MSVNLLQRLRAILPSSQTTIAEVMAVNADGTSTLRLPTGLGQEVYATGVSVGSTFTARGTSVPVGQYAYVRDGIVQSQAPTGVVSDVVLGTVVAQPFGPARLALADPAPTLLPGQVSVPYSASVAVVVAGGYPPLVFTLASGALPAGLTLAASGALAGTPTTAGTYSFAVACADSTRRSVTSATVGVVVAP